MDVQVYSSKERASVIVDGKVVRADPVTSQGKWTFESMDIESTKVG